MFNCVTNNGSGYSRTTNTTTCTHIVGGFSLFYECFMCYVIYKNVCECIFVWFLNAIGFNFCVDVELQFVQISSSANHIFCFFFVFLIQYSVSSSDKWCKERERKKEEKETKKYWQLNTFSNEKKKLFNSQNK